MDRQVVPMRCSDGPVAGDREALGMWPVGGFCRPLLLLRYVDYDARQEKRLGRQRIIIPDTPCPLDDLRSDAFPS